MKTIDKLKKLVIEAEAVPTKGEIATDIAIWKEPTVATSQPVEEQTTKNGAATPDLLVDADNEKAELEQRLAMAREHHTKE